ncbi:hypothetical protein ACMD2_26269 [Ananas comosus]|uniref:Uncharacterized protein n=1 Tax=Ananas comosus TaxID=4615 RepID=A0A199USW3_ANACO|nr:hypothetical protein ACMD2_26269 [Ananas comosus]
MVRNLISRVVAEVELGLCYHATRSVDLNWEMRAVRVLPIFYTALSSVMYSTYVRFTRMLDRRDKYARACEAERKAKMMSSKREQTITLHSNLFKNMTLIQLQRLLQLPFWRLSRSRCWLEVSVENEAKTALNR